MSLSSALGTLFHHLPPTRRRTLVPLMALMLVGALAEVVTIGAIVPLLTLIAAPVSGQAGNNVADRLLGTFKVDDPAFAIYAVTGLFASAALVSAGLRLVLLWVNNKFVFGVSYDLAVKLYADTLALPYSYHTQRNSSEIIASINKAQIVSYNVLLPLAQAFTSAGIALFIIAGLVVLDPAVAFIVGSGFAAIYLSISVTARRRLDRNSHIIASTQTERVQVMQEGLGGIRDVLLDRSQPVFLETYERAEADFRDARVKSAFLANGPRFVVEALGVVLIAIVAVTLVQQPGGLSAAIPVLGALALGAQKLLPLVQQLYIGWASAMANRKVLADVVALLDRAVPPPAPAEAAMPFEAAIELDHVCFTYPGSDKAAASCVSLKVPKGARVGIAGKTGSGKSTLMDLIIGLLEPTEGEIRIDGVRLTAKNRANWQRNIAHVPQAIFLADASVAENIAFGVRKEEIDHARVRHAAEQAELADVVAALPEGYDTRVGERGIQLSGGQRQRIGIARALYKQATVLVFDEATSALDTETESAVMTAIDRLDRDLTILIIAHRLSTLEGCDMIVWLEAGRMREKSAGSDKKTRGPSS